MKVRRTISIDREIDKEIEKILDEKISNMKAKSYKELKRLNRSINYSSVVEELIRKALKAKRFGIDLNKI